MNAYLLVCILLFLSIYFSFIDLFDKKNDDNYTQDFFPKTRDCSKFKKFVWYFSQITYQVQLLLFIYFLMRFFGKRNDTFYKIIAAPSLIVSLNYFMILYPSLRKKKLGIHKFTYTNMVSHLFNSIIILMELKSIKRFKFVEVFYCLPIILISLCSILYNYNVRKIWTYNLLNIKKKFGRKIILQSVSMTLFLSFILMLIHKNI